MSDEPSVGERSEVPSAPSQTHDTNDALAHLARGHAQSEQQQFFEAERSFHHALALAPELPMAHNNLAWVHEMQGDLESAAAGYHRALELNPSLDIARRNLAMLLSKLERFEQALPHWKFIVAAHPDDWGLLGKAIHVAMHAGDPLLAFSYAERRAALSRASRWYPRCGHISRLLPRPRAPLLSAAKLRHDIEQLCHLDQQGLLDSEFKELIHRHERVLADLEPSGADIRVPLGDAERALIGDTYGRIVHVRPTPRVRKALSESWQASAEDTYLAHRLGVVVIDEFLCEEAFHSLRQFCLQSTVWFANKYRHGRLGAFLRDGFNCPLLLQIGEELRSALPRLIGDKHPLLQVWGFKYESVQPKTCAHADFAAINVNFWMTPDDANLDPESGGMIIYDVAAPRDWTFRNYNQEGDKIEAFLAEQRASGTVIPYRANRAVIFNSDLFHATAPLRFRSRYEDRRINITMLYGTRDQAGVVKRAESELVASVGRRVPKPAEADEG